MIIINDSHRHRVVAPSRDSNAHGNISNGEAEPACSYDTTNCIYMHLNDFVAVVMFMLMMIVVPIGGGGGGVVCVYVER